MKFRWFLPGSMVFLHSHFGLDDTVSVGYVDNLSPIRSTQADVKRKFSNFIFTKNNDEYCAP